MAIHVRCDRCECELSGYDDAYLFWYGAVDAWMLADLGRTPESMLKDGDNIILCEKCKEDVRDFIEAGVKK